LRNFGSKEIKLKSTSVKVSYERIKIFAKDWSSFLYESYFYLKTPILHESHFRLRFLKMHSVLCPLLNVYRPVTAALPNLKKRFKTVKTSYIQRHRIEGLLIKFPMDLIWFNYQNYHELSKIVCYVIKMKWSLQRNTPALRSFAKRWFLKTFDKF
jgi:hypothetical protein